MVVQMLFNWRLFNDKPVFSYVLDKQALQYVLSSQT